MKFVEKIVSSTAYIIVCSFKTSAVCDRFARATLTGRDASQTPSARMSAPNVSAGLRSSFLRNEREEPDSSSTS